MTATLFQFPRRRFVSVLVERECDAWVVLCRQHGWLHGNRRDALDEAREIAQAYGLPVREAVPC